MMVLDAMPVILCAMAFMFALGIAFGLAAGFCWGAKRTSGETCAVQDLIDRLNIAEEEIERLRDKLKYGLSID